MLHKQAEGGQNACGCATDQACRSSKLSSAVPAASAACAIKLDNKGLRRAERSGCQRREAVVIEVSVAEKRASCRLRRNVK